MSACSHPVTTSLCFTAGKKQGWRQASLSPHNPARRAVLPAPLPAGVGHKSEAVGLISQQNNHFCASDRNSI